MSSLQEVNNICQEKHIMNNNPAEQHNLDIPVVNHWIAGRSVSPVKGEYFDDLNPLDDSLYARVAEGTVDDIDHAVKAAHAAFADYRQTLAREREAWLNNAADLLAQKQTEFAAILIDEVGSSIGKAEFEINYATGYLRAAAGATRHVTGQTIPSDIPGRLSMSVRQPLGVVAGITPFNVPLIKGIKHSAMPLATGNTYVHLPSEDAPVMAQMIGELYAEAGFPAGVFNVVMGHGDRIGDKLTTHPLVKMVGFTGSTRVGRHIGALCGEHGKRVVLELGGKNPLIVLADADIEQAVQGAVMSMFLYQGQICMAASRIYVERPVYQEFVEKFKLAAEQTGCGDLHDHATLIGPIINERQRNRVRTHIEDARDKGATLITGGEWQGNRCLPTIFTDVTEEMTLCREETFGPVTAVYPVDSIEEAMQKANDSVYGLSAAVYTSNLNHALKLAQGIDAGMVHVNAPSVHDEPHVPFGGMGESGTGREGTTEADLDVMTEWKWITVQL